MVKKKQKKKTTTKKKPNKELLNKIRLLEVDLKYTLQSIDGKSKVLDEIFAIQADKIRNEMKELEGKQ